jgi:hypothetical protein
MKATALAAALTAALPCLAHAAPLYSLTPIESGNVGATLYPTSMNNRGHVAGYFNRNAAGSLARPFAWYGAGPARELAVPPGTADSVFAYGINNLGEVVGRIGNDSVIWSADGGVRIVAPPAGYTLISGTDLNDAGTLLTEASNGPSGAQSAFRRHADGSVEELPGFHPAALNQRGAAVGIDQVWEADGTVRTLTSPDGPAYGFDINDAGWVAGKVVVGDVGSPAVWRQGGLLTVIPLPAHGDEDNGNAYGINNNGEVVGEGFHNAIYWSEAEGLVDLQTRLDASGAGWVLNYAVDINDTGQVLAFAGREGVGGAEFYSVVLTPVPEPSAAMALATFFFAAVRCRRCRPGGRSAVDSAA